MRRIDADALKEWIENWFVKNAYYHPYSKSNNIPIPELYDILERMPTVDAEPVVRCKDCICQPTCIMAQYLGSNGYCSNGERREDAD